MDSSRRLEVALAEHRAAVHAFVSLASGISQADWDRPAAQGKWSPGEITAHLRLTLERLREELEGGRRMRYVLPSWKRLCLRWVILRRILRTGRFPNGAPAPRETRPASSGPPQAEALRDLVAAADELATACRSCPTARRRLTHPYFGSLTVARFHRLLAIHTLHHRAQLPGGQWRI
jgi:hypothetical protein